MYCKDCAFVEVKDDLCFCRCLPPFYHFPIVKPEDFCGQFKAKEEVKQEEQVVILEEKQVVILEEEKPEVKIITKEDTSIKKNKKKKV